ncbi:MAG: zf-HC2 domain-containing protein, partial [Chloroflexi bacterium]|nr:zf-HC2 domain-containing protein [Chloroflexota bacterium]
MRPAVDPHLPFRRLLAERLDGVLTHEDTARLRAHLATCPRCRMAERAYLRDRQLLRRLTPRPPPRDLWVKTAAALDREIARWARHAGQPPHGARTQRGRRARRSESPVLMLSALASFVLGVA